MTRYDVTVSNFLWIADCCIMRTFKNANANRYGTKAMQPGVCLKIEIHEIHSNATLAKYRNPRNPQTVRNPHRQGSQQTNRQLL